MSNSLWENILLVAFAIVAIVIVVNTAMFLVAFALFAFILAGTAWTLQRIRHALSRSRNEDGDNRS